MPTRKAEVKWSGDLSAGKGIMKLGSGAFQRLAEMAKKRCPVSKALAGVKIELNAALL